MLFIINCPETTHLEQIRLWHGWDKSLSEGHRDPKHWVAGICFYVLLFPPLR